jgi:hypothetical protein
MDSARLAGLLGLFDSNKVNKDLLSMYVINRHEAVRAPFDDSSGLYPNNPNNFTRDQLLCLVAGLHHKGCIEACQGLLRAAIARGNRAQNTEKDAPGTAKTFPDGPDWLTPSNMNHLRICAGEQPGLLGKLWLIAEVFISSKLAPAAEPNQLIAMCVVAGASYVKLLKNSNPKLRDAVEAYWTGWRNEEEVSQLIIASLRL